MIFTKLARLLALLALGLGILRVALGILIVKEVLLPYNEALARYAPGYSSAGEIIDKGVYTIIFAVALGVLAEMSGAVHKL
jgi:hypothetical protein